MTKKTWVTQAAAGGYTHSIARVYPQGASLVTLPYPDKAFREGLLSISIQNRDNQSIFFWHGRVSDSLANHMAGVFLPLDHLTWTTQQNTDAGLFIGTYGEEIKSAERYTPAVAHYSPVYAYVAGGEEPRLMLS